MLRNLLHLTELLATNDSSLVERNIHSQQNTVDGVSLIEIIVLSTLNIIGSLVGVLGNLTVLFVVVKFRFLGRQKAEFLVCSLCCSDLLVCFIAQPLYLVHLIKALPSALNVIRSAVTWTATIASVTSLLAISIDRFLVLYILYRYRAWMSSTTAWLAVGIPWVISVTFGISNSFSRDARFFTQYYVIAVLLVVAVLYSAIFFIVRVQCSKLKCHFPATLSSRNLVPGLAREKMIAKLIAVVVGVFYACYTPLLVLSFFTSFESQASVAWRIFPWVNTLALCNSCVNPYIYYWGNWRFRSAIIKVNLGKVFSKLRMIRTHNT